MSRPAVVGSASPAATRVMVRLARRDSRRHLGRTLLVVALLAVPIAAAIVVAAGQRALYPPADEQTGWYFGQADAVVRSSFVTPLGTATDAMSDDELAATLGVTDEQARQLGDWAATADAGFVGDVVAAMAPDGEVAAVSRAGTISGRRGIEILGVDPTRPVTEGIVELARGAWPGSANEITLTPNAARALGVDVGDSVRLEPLGAVEVTGLHLVRADAGAYGVVARPEAPGGWSSTDYLIGGLSDRVDLTARLRASLADRVGPGLADTLLTSGSIYAAPTDAFFGSTSGAPLRLDRPPVLAGFVAAALLVEVGLIAAAAHATGIRRRLRELGLLATVGAAPSQIRRLVLAEAAMSGVAGVALGCAAGMVATRALAGPIADLPVHVVDRVSSSRGDLIAPALIGLAAAVLAAWWPARTASRVPALAALAGRMPVRPLALRAVPTALSLLAAGLIAIAAGATTARHDLQLSDAAIVVMLVGCLLCLAGAATAGAWLIGRMARRAGRLSLGLRLVARDAGRQQFRSAVAVAGLVVVLAAPVAVAAAVVTAEADSRSTFTPSALGDEVLISRALASGEEAGPVPADVVGAVEAVTPGRVIGSYALLGVHTTHPDGTSTITPIWASGPASGPVALGTPEAAAALRLGDDVGAQLDDGIVVATSTSAGAITLLLPPSGEGDPTQVPLSASGGGDRPASWATPAYLVPPAVARELGLVAQQTTTVFVADTTISPAERDAIWYQVGALGGDQVWVEVGETFEPFSARIQAVALPVSLAVVLVVGASLVAIAATESDRDLAIMGRVGATPSLRRRFFALQGWYHAALAALLAVPVGVLMLVALRRSMVDPPPLVVPWVSVLVVLVAIPLGLALVIGLAVRSAPVRRETTTG